MYNMLKDITLIIAALAFILVNQNCGSDSLVAPSDLAFIQGKVIQTGTLRAIEDVLVRTLSFTNETTTDSKGEYRLEIPLLNSDSRVLQVNFSKPGFSEETVLVSAMNGTVTKVPDITLIEVGDIAVSSGPAANIILVEVETSSVFVKGSGGNETSDITFEVRDNEGIPVDLDHKEMVHFRIEGGPNGGEFLSPDSLETNNNGRVMATINSGIFAGALQVVATIPGKIISSAPVPISIHGGLPDLAHFSTAVENLNFPGYNLFGLEDRITAFVGDRFSNPVPPGTSVQYQSTGGIVAGSAVTDALGRASAVLTSAEPRPQGINFGSLKRIQPGDLPAYFAEKGYSLITAQTIDENQETIYAEAIVLFSGVAGISAVDPTSFSLQAGESQFFTYSVNDQNNNPLAPGTAISVTATAGEVTGDTNINMRDTLFRGGGSTNFVFVLANSKPDDLDGPQDVTVRISVRGPNGDASALIPGRMFP